MHQPSLPLAIGTDGPDLTRYIVVVTVLVIGLCAVAIGLKRFIGGRPHARSSKRGLRIVEVLPLGNRRQLAVVRCYDRTFALGLGEREVSLVAELDPVEAGEAPTAAQSFAPTIGELAPFDELLERAQVQPQPQPQSRSAVDLLIDDELEELVR